MSNYASYLSFTSFSNHMRFLPHLLFGIFSGLLVYYYTSNYIAFLIMVFVQIGLILDFINKYLGTKEWLHTVLSLIIVSFVAFVALGSYWIYVFIAYFSHLFLDLFVYEEIPLLFPSKKQLMFPIKHSETIVMVFSVIGSLILLSILLL